MIKLVALENDWHLAFCSRLKGELFQFKPYHSPPDCDYDHCAAC
jgi:hypothetical protein